MTTWSKVQDHDGDAHLPWLDPYQSWAERTNWASFGGKPAALPVILELNTSVKSFGLRHWDTNQESLSWLALPGDFQHPPPALENATFCTAIVTPTFFAEVRNLSSPIAQVVKRFEMGVPARTLKSIAGLNKAFAPGRDLPARPRRAPLNPGQVVVGIIDDAIAFAHERFADWTMMPRSTRIESVWMQDVLPPGPLDWWLVSGGELTRPAIEALVAAATVNNRLDEDFLYRSAGLRLDVPGHKSLARRTAHGTHVMDLACGEAPGAVTAQTPRIVAVQLPDIVTEQTSGALLTPYALAGIWHILIAAAMQSPPGALLPVVINLSYGTTSGPHDGTAELERAMDEIVYLCSLFKWKVSIVLPSGNSHVARVHARASLPPGKGPSKAAPAELPWLVLPDDRTDSYLEVWMPCSASFRDVELEVVTPTGDVSPAILEGTTWTWPAGGPIACSVDYTGFGSLGSRRMALVSLKPTASIAAGATTAPAGTWRIRLRNKTGAQLDVDGRIRRDDNAFGYPIVGRQSRFEHPLYERFTTFGLPQQIDPPPPRPSVVVYEGSINGIATGARPVVVAGCRVVDLETVPYSGAGPVTQPQGCAPATRAGPDLMVPCEQSIACGGILAAGTRSGSIVAMNGTSVAAPQLTRILADSVRAGGAGGGNDARARATAYEAALPPGSGPKPPPVRGGAGRLELPATSLPQANGKRPQRR